MKKIIATLTAIATTIVLLIYLYFVLQFLGSLPK